jgi:hypothetical protein
LRNRSLRDAALGAGESWDVLLCTISLPGGMQTRLRISWKRYRWKTHMSKCPLRIAPKKCTVLETLGCVGASTHWLPSAVAPQSWFYRAAQLQKTRLHCTPHSLATLANQGSESHTAPQDSQATGGCIALTMAHELLRMFHVGMQRRQRRLKYAQRLASQRESSMHIAEVGIAGA